jgi:hypothetical protein
LWWRTRRQPEKEIERLFDFLGESYDSRAMEAIRRPSVMVSEQSRQAIVLGEEMLSKWQKELTRAQIRRSVGILSIFGLDRVYTDSPMPSEAGALEMMQGYAQWAECDSSSAFYGCRDGQRGYERNVDGVQ